MLLRLLVVRRNGSDLLPGEPHVAAYETQWQWIPSEAWAPGEYAVVVGTTLGLYFGLREQPEPQLVIAGP